LGGAAKKRRHKTKRLMDQEAQIGMTWLVWDKVAQIGMMTAKRTTACGFSATT